MEIVNVELNTVSNIQQSAKSTENLELKNAMKKDVMKDAASFIRMDAEIRWSLTPVPGNIAVSTT